MRFLFPTLLLLAFVLEPTLGARLDWIGGHPLLVLATVVYYSLVHGATAGTLFGLGLGAFSELGSLAPPGLTMLSFSIVGFCVGSTLDSLYKDNGWTQAVVLFLAVLLHESIAFLMITRLDLRALPLYLVRHALLTGALTALTGPLVLAGLERLFHWDIYIDAHRVVIQRRRASR